MPLKGKKLKSAIKLAQSANKINRSGGPRNVAQGRTVNRARIDAEERVRKQYR